jgi:UrcA family protein
MKKSLLQGIASVVAASLLSSGAVGQELGEISIEASRIDRTLVGHTSARVPIYIVSTTRQVKASDLDLATPEGLAELEKRVSKAATEACADIDRAHPNAQPDTRQCAKSATDRTMSQVRELLAIE